jgi:serine/threonine protein kinase/DNA-binding XRE family transcriptional regulator
MNVDVSFGEIVRERRNVLGLTQTELARRVGCAAITIRKIEAGDLRPSVQMAELIAVALNIPDEEQLAFVHLARAARPPSPIPTPSPAPGEIGMTDLSGRAVKGFQLGEKIGSGGFGVVYKAIQPLVERDVAIKIILPRYANHPNFIRRFEAEAQLIARLEHPHIVPLYDYWREPDAAYLIMRFLRGGSLEDQLQSGPIPIELVGKYIYQIGLALDLAHRNGVVHRDIKPANVLLDEEANAYLADFGIAKYLKGIDGQSLTEGSALIGSPAYISPEQIMAEPVKPPSDIYCLGIMLYEMLTGNKPFQAQLSWPSFSNILASHCPLFKKVIPSFHLNWMLSSTRPPPKIPPIDIKMYLL